MSWTSMASLSVAGPRVAMILVRRFVAGMAGNEAATRPAGKQKPGLCRAPEALI
jgi:hypothetical protein